MTILVVTAVEAERDVVVRDLAPAQRVRIGSYVGHEVETPHDDVMHVFHGGVGPISVAVTTATLLALGPRYDLVISAGIGGGFAGRAEIGDLVLADQVVAADLGALTDDGFHTRRDLGLPGEGGYAIGLNAVRPRLEKGPYRLVVGTVLTLSCMTGTQARADELAARHPKAVAEAMEGYGVLEGVRDVFPRTGHDPWFAEIRAISNVIGRRDRSTWDLPAAFDVLAGAFATLVSTPPPISAPEEPAP